MPLVTSGVCAQQYAYCMEDNCYELLGVEKDAGGLTIKRSYRKLAIKCLSPSPLPIICRTCPL